MGRLVAKGKCPKDGFLLRVAARLRDQEAEQWALVADNCLRCAVGQSCEVRKVFGGSSHHTSGGLVEGVDRDSGAAFGGAHETAHKEQHAVERQPL